MKKIYTFILLISICCSHTLSVLADYNDIEYVNYKKEIDTLISYNIMVGNDDNKFYPTKTLTRAEMATIITNLLGKIEYDINNITIFQDVQPTHWAYSNITQVSSRNIMTGDGYGIFRPDDPISFGEILKICVEITGYDKSYTDVIWYKPYVEKAKDLNISEGIELDATQFITREQAAKIIYNTINIPIRELHGIKDEKGVIIGEFVICDGIQNELKTLLNQFNNQ